MLPQSTVNDSASKPIDRRWLLIAIASILAIGGGTTAYLRWRDTTSPPAQVPVSRPQIRTVTALGRIAPKGEIIKLSAPTASTAGSNRVEQLLVKEGDRVKKGQTIAILDNRDRLQASVEEAEKSVDVAIAKLLKIKAGAKQGEIESQRAKIDRLEAESLGDIKVQSATVERLKAEVNNAEIEAQRYESMYRDGASSASVRDNKRLVLDTARKSWQEAQATLNRTQSTRLPELEEAKATLAQIAEVRDVDVREAQTEVDRAIAAVKQAKAELKQAYVRSPQEGTILYINTRAGESVSDRGIVEIGETNPMYVVAEVYQSDVGKVRSGQKAIVTSDSIPDKLHGTVEWSGYQVRRQTVVNTDPSENIDSRIVEVWIRLDESSSKKAAKFTNLQVKAAIEL
jgi:HlyD family secretion protein